MNQHLVWYHLSLEYINRSVLLVGSEFISIQRVHLYIEKVSTQTFIRDLHQGNGLSVWMLRLENKNKKSPGCHTAVEQVQRS